MRRRWPIEHGKRDAPGKRIGYFRFDGNGEVFFYNKAGRKSLTKLIILILLQSFSLKEY